MLSQRAHPHTLLRVTWPLAPTLFLPASMAFWMALVVFSMNCLASSLLLEPTVVGAGRGVGGVCGQNIALRCRCSFLRSTAMGAGALGCVWAGHGGHVMRVGTQSVAQGGMGGRAASGLGRDPLMLIHTKDQIVEG